MVKVTRYALPVLLLAGLMLAWATGSMTAIVAPGRAILGPLPTPAQAIYQNAQTRQLCEQIISGKLRVNRHRGEVHARNQCQRDGW